MASVNLWLRGARGKFAGASLSKGTNGETIAREVVTPTNPNTDKQLYQRMIMATVMAAYAAGKEIFDHSFQGKAKGSACQQEFMQRNLLRLRSNIAQNLTNIKNGTITAKNCTAIVSGPKTKTPVPGDFVISDGTYQQTFFQLKSNGVGLTLAIRPNIENETVAVYAKRCNLIPGDIYTLVALSVDMDASPVWMGVDESGETTWDPWDSQYPCYFQFWRLQVKDNVLENTEAFTYSAAGALGKLFNLTDFRALDDTNVIRLVSPVSNTFVCSDLTSSEAAPRSATNLQYDFNVGSFGIIRSRYDEDLRSTTSMKTYINDTDDNNTLFVGISSGSALTQWRRGIEALGASSLVLESNT